jgi:hypothetical protein
MPKNLKRFKQTIHIQGNIHGAEAMLVRNKREGRQERKKYLFGGVGLGFKNSRFEAKRVGLFFGYGKWCLVKLNFEQVDGLIVSIQQ